MSDIKLKQAILKLAQKIKSQDSEIKKLSQDLTTQQIFNKVMQEANSLLPVLLHDMFGGGVTVKLEGEGNDYTAYVNVTVKGKLDEQKKAAINASLADKFQKMPLGPFKVKLGGVTFVEPGTSVP